MPGSPGGRWPWTARRCGALVMPADGQAVHLLAALDQRAGAVLGQVRVDCKTNEITRFAPLLEPLDLAGCVITADALHTQREHAQFLVAQKKAHYILVVKKNQPGLYAQVKNLPGGMSRSPPASTAGATAARSTAPSRPRPSPPGSASRTPPRPSASPARHGPWTAGGGGPSPSTPSPAWTLTRPPAQLAAWIRGHWKIEALHHVRDMVYDEDRSQVRTRNGPQAMATLRNLAIAILKTAGHTSIAAACRHHARDATRTLETLGLHPA